jgi:hypothetical protein
MNDELPPLQPFEEFERETERELAGDRRPFHPAADIFPLLNEDSPEFKALAADIKAHGLLEPIWTLDGAIVIGRNRYNACRAAGVEPRINAFNEGINDDPLTLVISSNRHRRQWAPAQLAWVGLGLAEPSLPSRARVRLGISGQLQHDTSRSSTMVGESLVWFKWRKPEMPRAEAARRMSINIDQINTAADVKKVALPGIVAAIWDGRIKTIGYAYSIVTPDKDEKLEGLSSEDKQRAWLADPRNTPRKPRQPRQPTTIRITDRVLKTLGDLEATVVVAKLAPKANRALKPEGKQWKLAPIGGDEQEGAGRGKEGR